MNEKTTGKYATARDATDAISADCNDILALLQAVAVKALRVAAIPILMCADKRTGDWFHQWSAHHLEPLSTLLTTTPQDNFGLTVVLRNVMTGLQNA